MQKSKIGIKVRNLSISYKDTMNLGLDKGIVALKNINLDIPENELTAIIGPSGCGKSTLLKALNRLLEERADIEIKGAVYIGGENIYDSKKPVYEIRKNIGLVDQKPFPLPASIYDNVAYGPRLHRRLKKAELDRIVEKYLRVVHLWEEVKDRLDFPAASLSIGQQQRLCLARTLSVEPEIILCDEITSALDPISSEKVENLLLSLKERYTVIMVTHVLRQAKRLADYVVFMYLGEVIEASPSEKFFNNPLNELSKKYIKGLMAGF
ncbi:MAG: phosphate ABC transporter ATP-binding protein [candidate division WOR-3 bacterium]